jgi:hypothetical protein
MRQTRSADRLPTFADEEDGPMTLERKYHIVAISLLVIALAAGGVSYAEDGTSFWILVGVSLACIAAGLVFAGRAERETRKRKNPEL